MVLLVPVMLVMDTAGVAVEVELLTTMERVVAVV